MERRLFLEKVMQLTAVTSTGLVIPEWLLDPPKGRSMVTVPDLVCHSHRFWFVDPGKLEDAEMWMEMSAGGCSWETAFPSLDNALDTIGDTGESTTIYCRGENMISGFRTIRNTNLVFSR